MGFNIPFERGHPIRPGRKVRETIKYKEETIKPEHRVQ